MFDVDSVKYNQDGLVPVIAQEEATGDVLMLAWMNAKAIEMTLTSREVTYWSRSRSEFWIKGKTSGHTQKLIDLRIDCDRDCLLAIVEQVGPACHTNRKSCFYTSINSDTETVLMEPMKD